MAEAYIVEAVRTPVGRRRGGLSGVHPAGRVKGNGASYSPPLWGASGSSSSPTTRRSLGSKLPP